MDMDKIWDGKSEVIGHCGWDEKNEWPCRTDKVKRLKKIKESLYSIIYFIDNTESCFDICGNEATIV